MNTGTWLDYFLIALAILLPFGVIKYLIREKYAQQVLLLGEGDRGRLLKSSAWITKWTKLFLYISPLILIILPYSLYQSDGFNLLKSIALSVLLLITVGLEYMWLWCGMIYGCSCLLWIDVVFLGIHLPLHSVTIE